MHKLVCETPYYDEDILYQETKQIIADYLMLDTRSSALTTDTASRARADTTDTILPGYKLSWRFHKKKSATLMLTGRSACERPPALSRSPRHLKSTGYRNSISVQELVLLCTSCRHECRRQNENQTFAPYSAANQWYVSGCCARDRPHGTAKPQGAAVDTPTRPLPQHRVGQRTSSQPSLSHYRQCPQIAVEDPPTSKSRFN